MIKTTLLNVLSLAFIFQSCENKNLKVNGDKLQNADTIIPFHSERIRDSIFENVIEIADEDVTTKGSDFLFNVSIPKSEETPVLFVSARVPLEILSGIYPEFPKLIVIAPNWVHYDRVGKLIDSQIGSAEPRTSTIIYEFQRENDKLLKDSIITWDNFPKMNFKIK